MSLQIAVSDSLTRRVPDFAPSKLYAFQLACADIAKGRAAGDKVFVNRRAQREFYVYQLHGYNLYYSQAAGREGALIFEEFLSAGEEDTILDTFAEGSD
jgi:hypothetical protein